MTARNRTSATTNATPPDTADVQPDPAGVHRRLRAAYGVRPAMQENRPVLDAVISTLLTQSTTRLHAARAMAALKTRFVDWAAVRDADPQEIAAEIHSAGLAQVKAARIKLLLERVWSELGRMSLDFLRDADVEEARAVLLTLPGIGPKSAAHVVSFVLGAPDIPVGTHVLRVIRRLGWVPHNANAAAAYERLRPAIPDEAKTELHQLLVTHGRTACTARRPACAECPLADVCAHPPAP